jgi:hypothetical protein
VVRACVAYADPGNSENVVEADGKLPQLYQRSLRIIAKVTLRQRAEAG